MVKESGCRLTYDNVHAHAWGKGVDQQAVDLVIHNHASLAEMKVGMRKIRPALLGMLRDTRRSRVRTDLKSQGQMVSLLPSTSSPARSCTCEPCPADKSVRSVRVPASCQLHVNTSAARIALPPAGQHRDSHNASPRQLCHLPCTAGATLVPCKTLASSMILLGVMECKRCCMQPCVTEWTGLALLGGRPILGGRKRGGWKYSLAILRLRCLCP